MSNTRDNISARPQKQVVRFQQHNFHVANHTLTCQNPTDNIKSKLTCLLPVPVCQIFEPLIGPLPTGHMV